MFSAYLRFLAGVSQASAVYLTGHGRWCWRQSWEPITWWRKSARRVPGAVIERRRPVPPGRAPVRGQAPSTEGLRSLLQGTHSRVFPNRDSNPGSLVSRPVSFSSPLCRPGKQKYLDASVYGSGRSPGDGNGSPVQYPRWGIPWAEEPGGLQSVGSQRVGHDWAAEPFPCVKGGSAQQVATAGEEVSVSPPPRPL